MSSHDHGAVVGPELTTRDLHEHRLARTVLARERGHRAGSQVQRDPLQDGNPTERLIDVAALKGDLRHLCRSSQPGRLWNPDPGPEWYTSVEEYLMETSYIEHHKCALCQCLDADFPIRRLGSKGPQSARPSQSPSRWMPGKRSARRPTGRPSRQRSVPAPTDESPAEVKSSHATD